MGSASWVFRGRSRMQLFRSSGTQNTNTDNENRWLHRLSVAAAIVLTLLVFSGVSLWVWPVASSKVTAWGLGWLPHRSFEPDQVRDLGAQLLGGAVVASAVLLVETLVEIRFRRTERLRIEQDEERNFRLQMGLQKDLIGIDLTGRDLTSYFLRAKNLSEAGLETRTWRALISREPPWSTPISQAPH